MQIDQLRNIMEVAKTGSMTTAAQKHYMTLSAISQSISQLEKELGVKLFIRTKSGAVPTPEGERIIGKAAEILAHLEDLEMIAQISRSTITLNLRVAGVPGSLSVLVETAAELKQSHPNIRSNINEYGSQHIVNDIQNDLLDMGFIILLEGLLEKNKGLEFEPVTTGEIVVAVGKRSPLAGNRRITPEALMKHPLVLYDEQYILHFTEQLARQYGKPNLLFVSNNLDVLDQAILDGQAAAIGLSSALRIDPLYLNGEFILMDLDINTPPYQLGWIYPKKVSENKVLRKYRDLVKLKLTSLRLHDIL